jgi:hypothetical protein
MSLDFTINDFKFLYCDKLLSREEMIRKLNITDYTYKKIIKEFNLNRCKTNKINRFKANNGLTTETKENEANDIINNIEVIKKDNESNEDNQDILKKVKETLEKSKKNRTTKK